MAAIDNVNLREGTVIRIFWLRFQLFARLFFVRLYRSNRPHTFGSPQWDCLRVSKR